jgi:hypothetical protein
MVCRCKVGMRSVLEAFRTPSTIDEQGLITIDHMILSTMQTSCQLYLMKQISDLSRMGQ